MLPTTNRRLVGPDEARASRPVLREREDAIPSRRSREPHARFDGLEKESTTAADHGGPPGTEGLEPGLAYS
jgi:hypothetical protein